ncbi:MAG TPA: hypothetical protein VFW11_08310 [Cyclobacteriaceae bacterium]|nr:hypothetical protein [Cyclobacteriaceae bacterium]
MRAATIHEIKKELETLDPGRAEALCLRLAKFKQENKELLTYLLFEAYNEQDYIDKVKRDVEEQFEGLTNLNVYYVKKSLRRILRMVNRQIRYSGLPETELALRIYFCHQIKKSALPIDKSAVLTNLYQQQVKKIRQALTKLNEDLQYDYQVEIERLT